MRITPELTDAVVLQEIGARLERQRIEAGLTQAALAEQAGVSKRTLERIEAGHSAELLSLIRVLRVLRLTDGLQGLVPEVLPSPLALLKRQGKQRRRVSHTRSAPAATTPVLSTPGKPWEWGE
jgi:DNA-binding XRE family transcriptional regulator